MLPSIFSDFFLCGSYFHVYFRCDLLNCITLIFHICLRHSHSLDTYCKLFNNLQRFNKDLFILTTDLILFKTGSMNLNTSHSHRILTKKASSPSINKGGIKVCFGYNNLYSNNSQHIGSG